MPESIALTIAVIGTAGLLCQWLAWRVKLPAILFLLLAGIFLGPGINWLDPDQLLGDLFFPLVSLSVAIILFEGSVRPNQRIANVLRWEGIMIDPIGALLAVLVYESIISLGSGENLSHTFFLFCQIILTGGLVGY